MFLLLFLFLFLLIVEILIVLFTLLEFKDLLRTLDFDMNCLTTKLKQYKQNL